MSKLLGRGSELVANRPVLLLGILVAGIILVTTGRHLWPVYFLMAFWVYVITKEKTKENLAAAAVATIIFGMTAVVWNAVLAASMAPPGQKMAAFNHYFTWLGLANVLAGYGGNELIQRARAIWGTHQLWFVPVIILTYKLTAWRLKNMNSERETLHGSARFAEPEEVGLTGHREGFLLGRTRRGFKEVVMPLKEVFEHVLIVGAPGAGKSTAVFIPNILRISGYDERRDRSNTTGSGWEASGNIIGRMISQINGSAGTGYANLVVTDPKTELLGVCGPELVKAGYEILVYHPYSPELSDAWNMMAHMKDFETVDDAVVSVIKNTGESKDNYWDNQTNILLDLICYHLRETLGERASMSHVQAIAGAAKPRDIEVVLKNSKNPKIRANAAGFFSRIGENEKLVSSIMSDLPRRLKLWTLDPIRATTHINEIDFSVLCTDKKVALFVVTPMDKKEQLKPLFATFFTQLFKVVQEKGRELGKLPRPLWFFLDEFANLGTIPNFDNFLTVVRGYRVGVVMGIQSRSQLEELYGKERAKTIIESCATYIISPRIGVEDAKYFSEMLGKTTRLTVNKTFTKRLLFYEPEHKEAEAAVPRPLMGPDEIRSLDKDESLLVIAGTRRPVHIAPALYYRDPRWRELGRECYDEKNLQERRLQFYRVNRGKPPLLVPGEEAMMEEAAVVAMPEIIERQSGKVGSNADKEKRETGPDVAGNGRADVDSKLTGLEGSLPGETGSPGKTVRDSDNEREPEEKDIQEKNKARHTLDMDSIQITVKRTEKALEIGNPFKSKKR